VGVEPEGRDRPRAARRSPWDPPEPPPPPRGLTTIQKAIVGVFVGALYLIGMVARGEVLPGIVGGVLGGLLCFLVLREFEHQRERRWRQRYGRS
jgi:hypothetical protein